MKTVKYIIVLIVMSLSFSLSASDDIWGNQPRRAESGFFTPSPTSPFGDSMSQPGQMQRAAPGGGGGGIGVLPVRDVFTFLFFAIACYGAFVYRSHRNRNVRHEKR